jgi:DNA polymerase III subunit epsilon
MREIIFDTETTGLDPRTGDRLVEIGCIELVNRVPTGRNFHEYCNPQRPMPAEAEAVHGLSSAFLADKPLFADLAGRMIEFFGHDTPLIAHNASFDFGFLNAELALAGYPPLERDRMVDTLVLARRRHPGAKHSLDALCSRYGIDRSHRTRHGALLDAELLAQVYVELTGGRQIGLELAAETAIDVVSVRTAAPIQRMFREPRPHKASSEELQRHAAFLEKIESPLWNG